MCIVVPETCWASNKIWNKKPLLHLVGILFPHNDDDAWSKSHQMLLWLNIKTLFIMSVFILLKYILCVRWFCQQGRYQSTRQFICNAKPVYMSRHFICASFLETFCICAVALMRPVEGVNKFNREEWQIQLTPVLNLWKKLNQVCNASSTTSYWPVLKLYQVNWSEQSAVTVYFFVWSDILMKQMFSKPFVF